MPLWMILLYVVGIAIVVTIVILAFGVRAIGKAAQQMDLKRVIRIAKMIGSEGANAIAISGI